MPQIGTRLSLAGSLGTVRYVGNVDNTTGTWLGIEWDDPQRGKHDGVKDGKRYFSCSVPNSGSFIRPTAHGISYGTNFLHALSSRYLELPRDSDAPETVILGSSNGAIQVEAVRLDKIRNKLSDLERLREVSLENELVSRADDPGLIRKTCPNIRGLDLSTSLLPDWDTVMMISVELPMLQRLALNRNRLALPRDFAAMAAAFLHITDLHLNATLLSWQELEEITAFMPQLSIVEMGYNRITSLSEPRRNTVRRSYTLQSINLDGNECSQWAPVCQTLAAYPALKRLIMASNSIGSVPSREKSDPQLVGLKHLSLSSNRLRSWEDIDMLPHWCPALESLMVAGNPLVSDSDLARYRREFIVSKIPTLTSLDGAEISSKERNNCELFYLSYLAKNLPESEQKDQAQWQALCDKHGHPEQSVAINAHASDKLGSRLIELNLLRCLNSPTSSQDIHLSNSNKLTLRALPNMTLRSLRQKVCKTFKCNPNTAQVRLWISMNDAVAELDLDRDKQALDWLGIDAGTNILCWIQQE